MCMYDAYDVTISKVALKLHRKHAQPYLIESCLSANLFVYKCSLHSNKGAE